MIAPARVIPLVACVFASLPALPQPATGVLLLCAAASLPYRVRSLCSFDRQMMRSGRVLRPHGAPEDLGDALR